MDHQEVILRTKLYNLTIIFEIFYVAYIKKNPNKTICSHATE